MAQGLAQTVEKALVIAAQRIADQHAQRLGALGGQIGQVGGHQTPGHIGHVLIGQVMHALRQRSWVRISVSLPTSSTAQSSLSPRAAGDWPDPAGGR
jgi:hypothetical protein